MIVMQMRIISVKGCLPLFDKQIVDPNFAVQVVAVERFVNNSHLAASHDSYCL